MVKLWQAAGLTGAVATRPKGGWHRQRRCVDKDMSHVQLKSEQGGMKAALTTHNSVQLNTQELFSSRIFRLLFSADHK